MTSILGDVLKIKNSLKSLERGPRVGLSQLAVPGRVRVRDSTGKPGAMAVSGREARRMGPRRKLFRLK